MKQVTSLLMKRGWNRRVLTNDDFDEWCERDGVMVMEEEIEYPGFYLIRNTQPVIVLNKKLRGIERQIVAWHEYGHHVLHVPNGRFFCLDNIDKAEYQAHLIAAIALIPRPDLFRPLSELQEEGYPLDFLRFRSRVFDQFKI